MRTAFNAGQIRKGARRNKLSYSVYVSILAIAVGGLFAVPAMASSSTDRSPLKQGLAFYRGKTITLVCGGSVGGLFNLNCQNVVSAVDAYLHATVQIESIPNGNNVPAQDAANAATPNGLTFGELDVSNDVSRQLTNVPGLNFNPERDAFIGAAGPDVSVFLAAPTSGITSFAQIVDSPTPVKILDQIQGSGNVRLRTMIGVFGINANIVTGYSSSSQEQAGFVRGDGQVAELTFTNAYPLVKNGQARPLLLNTKLPAGFPGRATFAGVPTLQQFAKTHPPKSKLQKKAYAALLDFSLVLNAPVFFAPAAIPADRLVALRAAIQFAEQNKAVRALKLAEGLQPGYSTGPQAKAAYVQAINDAKVVLSYLNG